VVACFAAFLITQRLKHTPTVVQLFKLTPSFSPTLPGFTKQEAISFKLSRADEVTVTIDSAPSTRCAARDNFQISQQLLGPVVLPASSTTSLSALHTDRTKWPILAMRDLPTPQDNCLGTTFGLTYSAQGVK